MEIPTEYRSIHLELIELPPDFNRREDRQHIEHLAADISKHGLRHPLTVIPNDDKYDLVAGFQRFAALTHLSVEEALCQVLPPDTDRATLYEISIGENHVRKNERFADTVRRLEAIMQETGCTFAEAARRSSVNKAFASKCFTIENRLGDDAKALIEAHPKKLGISIAYEVARLAKCNADQIEAFKAVLDGRLTRDDITKHLRKVADQKTKKIDLQLVIEDMAVRLGIPSQATYEKLLAVVASLKTKLLAEQKHGTPIHALPELLK